MSPTPRIARRAQLSTPLFDGTGVMRSFSPQLPALARGKISALSKVCLSLNPVPLRPVATISPLEAKGPSVADTPRIRSSAVPQSIAANPAIPTRDGQPQNITREDRKAPSIKRGLPTPEKVSHAHPRLKQNSRLIGIAADGQARSRQQSPTPTLVRYSSPFPLAQHIARVTRESRKVA